ncbi:MAG: alpha/beta hydrolase, partial [Pauljensenia sp.]
AKEDSDGVPRYLMSLDTSGANVLAAVSQNNPDDADHIGVIVPGMTTSVANSLDEYDGHATVMREAAEKSAGPGQKVAMVEFFGYNAPPSVTEASNTMMAIAGAGHLASFLNGIDAVREHGAGDAHITVASHSYGSTTAGIAATLVGDGVIDDLVQFGSPGSGVQDVGEFHVPEGHMYASAAPYVNDMVQGVGPDVMFGKNPVDGYKHLSGDVGPIVWKSTKVPGRLGGSLSRPIRST